MPLHRFYLCTELSGIPGVNIGLKHQPDYVVVLNPDRSIAGIITKTSVATSVAENLWGGE